MYIANEEKQIIVIQPDLTLTETEIKGILRQRITPYQLLTPKGCKRSF